MRYQNGDIAIDDDFARFGSKSYAIDKINSVEVRVKARRGGCGGFVVLFFGIVFLIASLGMLATTPPGGTVGLVFTGLILWWGWRAIQASKLTDHTLVLTTNSGEAQATQGTDGEEIDKMRVAVEAAMRRR